MGRKIFVSYKHNDTNVLALSSGVYGTTARNYVDILERYFDAGDHIYKGERDNESLIHLKEDTIAAHLCDKMYDSSITIVLISKGMKETYVSESDQWIPWEISYSLKEMSRGGRSSTTNAMLAIVLPNENGIYDYCIQSTCPQGCRVILTNPLFKIIRINMFNRKGVIISTLCAYCNAISYDHPLPSYIHAVTWEEFVSNPNSYIETALNIKEDSDSYNITKEIT